MFAYCENRPIIGSDPTGEWVHIAVGAIVGGIMGGIQAGISNGNIVSGIATGALGGALAMSDVWSRLGCSDYGLCGAFCDR